MTDEPLTLQCGSDERFIKFADVIVNVPVTPMGGNLFRLDGWTLWTDLAEFGDIIAADTMSDGELQFIRVASPGGWRTHLFMLPASKIDSEWGQYLLTELESRGGHWERLLGGLLFISIPPGLDFDPTTWEDAI